jgi:hypothetical protein
MQNTIEPTVDEVKIQQDEAVIAEADKAISELSQVQALKAENEALKMKAAEVETIKVEANKVVKNALREQNVGLSMAGSYNSKLSDGERNDSIKNLVAWQLEAKHYPSDYAMSAMQSISRDLVGGTSLGERLNSARQYSIAGGFGTQNYFDISLPFAVAESSGAFIDNSMKVTLKSLNDKMSYTKMVTGSKDNYNEVSSEGNKSPMVQNQLVRFETRESVISKIDQGLQIDDAELVDSMSPESRVRLFTNTFSTLENMHLDKKARMTTHRQIDQAPNVTPAMPFFDAPFLANVNYVELNSVTLNADSAEDPYYKLWNSIQATAKDSYVVRNLGFSDYSTPSASFEKVKIAIRQAVRFLKRKPGSSGKKITLVIGNEMELMLSQVMAFYGVTNSTLPIDALAIIQGLGVTVVVDDRLDDLTGGAANPVAFIGYLDEYYVTATAPILQWFPDKNIIQFNGFDLMKQTTFTGGYRNEKYYMWKSTGFGAKVRDSSAAVFLTLQV